MFHLIPAPIHRAALRVGHRLRVAWWRARRPVTHGVSVMGFDRQGRLLLIRHSYGTPLWAMPGGRRRENEDPREAAAREFAEELCCPITQLEQVALREEPLHGSTNRVHVFKGVIEGEPRPDRREVIEARFFPLDALPSDLERRVLPRLAEAGLLEQR